MSRTGTRGRLAGALLIGIAFAGAVPTPASAQLTTRWVASLGNWGTAVHWSNGEPTVVDDAEIRDAGTAVVTQSGETCRNLTTGQDDPGNVLRIESGSLTVAKRIVIGAGRGGLVQLLAGSLTADELLLGPGMTATQFLMRGGTLSLRRAVIGSSNPGSGTLTTELGVPEIAIADSLDIARGGMFVAAVGSLAVGGPLRIDGVFQVRERPTMSAGSVTFGNLGILGVLVGPSGVAPLVVSGTASLDGNLVLTELLAPDGSYEILRAGSLEGSFDNVILPANWSWGVAGNSFYVIKGEVPVAGTTWSRLKAGTGEILMSARGRAASGHPSARAKDAVRWQPGKP